MPNQLYGGLDERDFRDRAIKAVADYWNANRTLKRKFGAIDASDVYVVWQVKVIQNAKALLGVNRDGDGMYFEFTWNGDGNEAYLDAYRKAAKNVVEY